MSKHDKRAELRFSTDKRVARTQHRQPRPAPRRTGTKVGILAAAQREG